MQESLEVKPDDESLKGLEGHFRDADADLLGKLFETISALPNLAMKPRE
jgi:hypothetical protein